MKTSETQQKKYKIETLGCRTNQYESQAYRDQLKELGYVEAAEGEVADICIVNTCTVTESADASSRHSIRQLARDHAGSKLIVTGCSAEKQPDLIRKIPGVTAIVPNLEKDRLLATLLPDEEIPEFSIKQFDSHTRAFVKVQDGCNSYCSYCIIPFVRGRSRSRTLPDVVKEVETLVQNGFKEIVLTGINVGDFDGGESNETEKAATLADLVRAVDAVPGLRRLRLSSIDPDEVDDDLLDAIVNGKNTCQSMHIVLQSGSNVILKRMRRKYTRQMFLDTVERLRQASPDFTFTTDIITGFPGETETDHQETLDLMQEVKFAKVHMFPYSDRPKTRSSRMPDKVPPDVMRRRKGEIMRLSEQVAFELRNRFVGRTMAILTETNEQGQLTGHSDNFLMAIVPNSGNYNSNTLLEVVFTENTPAGLIGKVIKK